MKSMKQCLRCDNLCVEPAIFCEQCQSALLNRSLQKSPQSEMFQTAPLPALDAIPTETDRAGRQHHIDGSTQINPASYPPPATRRRGKLRLIRRIFILLAVLAVVGFIVDSVLISVGFTHIDKRAQTFPLLTVTPGVVQLGQAVQLHLSHFTPFAQIVLTRDIQQHLRVDTPPTRASANGSADLHVLVESSWEPGSHYIEAEDVSAHYIASAVLQVPGAGPALPPQLQIEEPLQDMGSDWQGTNTLHALTLSNNGGGVISWSSQSNQPWLRIVPVRGVFSASQMVTIAVTRAGLKPGNYQGSIKIISSTNTTIIIQVKMSVRALPPHAGPVLVVAPPALAFTATDGANDPPAQDVTLSNPGSAPLQWSTTPGTASTSVDQHIPFNSNWLSVSPASGMLAPGASIALHVRVRNRVLLPGIFSGLLTLTSAKKTLNASQSVAIALDVQQRCGVMANVGSMSFIASVSQRTPNTQHIDLDATPGCANTTTPWSAFSLADWLSVTPATGQVGVQFGTSVTVGVESTILQSGVFTGLLVFLTEHRTQTIAVQLTMLPPPSTEQAQSQTMQTATPARSAPSHHNGSARSTPEVAGNNPAPPRLSISPAELTFNVTQEKSALQQVTFANSGRDQLDWRLETSGPSWLTRSSDNGSIQADQTQTLDFTAHAAGLNIGTYRTQITVSGVDATGQAVAGSPQMLPVTLNVLPPCVLQVSPARLSFSSSLLQPQSPDQVVHIQATGNCSWPVSWQTSINDGGQNWVSLSPGAGNEDGSGSSINVHVDASGKLLGNYSEQITFSAQDATGAAVTVDSATVAVSLGVLG